VTQHRARHGNRGRNDTIRGFRRQGSGDGGSAAASSGVPFSFLERRGHGTLNVDEPIRFANRTAERLCSRPLP